MSKCEFLMKNNLLKCFIISVAFSISYFNIICASDRLSSTPTMNKKTKMKQEQP